MIHSARGCAACTGSRMAGVPCIGVYMLFNTRNIHGLNIRTFLIGMA
jgi:hypothetical protein